MIIIPAIDLKEGRCVRLKQGRMADETIFSDVPEEIAVKWHEEGAERLHVVDLDGAIQGSPINKEVIKRIVNSVPVPVELGGGIRNMSALKSYFDLGLQYLILGTAAIKDPEFARMACESFPGQIIIGIDARMDRVSVQGWTEDSTLTPVKLAKRFEETGASAIIYTDIERDGMRTGPNLQATCALAREISIPVIVSGGISGISDVLNVLKHKGDGIMGMITGRALYDGSLDLSEAIKTAKG
ncbi:MAG: 1-(5-phosphoribosyl)-5-[(5-phosphoribosylamino)methylideneamino]imidazole-4-carboxamide isomerase [Deltaproteobacteria bacterium]|nr:1-(5-phosphoribosyl)-5-[(5-phosphoribosylamino)methylideneamino]imidazole-4-carboxamide isomerase [Deltaproteobacteria bacterium]